MKHLHTSLSKKRHLSILFAIVLLSFSLFFYEYYKRYDVYFFLGNTFFGEKILGHTFYAIDKAEYFFKKANQQDTPKKWINYQLARIRFIQGDLSGALYFADRELRLYPDNCRTHYIRGLTYGYEELLDEAIADFEIFNSCFPNTWAGHNDLAWFWFKKGDMEKVIMVAGEAITKENNSLSPWLQNTYGTALMNVGRYTEAENALLMAKYLADNMTEESWGNAYPGNDPLIYGEGLYAMRSSINTNLEILRRKMKASGMQVIAIPK